MYWWSKVGPLRIPTAGEDLEQQECCVLLMGMQIGRVTLEDNLALSYKTEHSFYHMIQHAPGTILFNFVVV